MIRQVVRQTAPGAPVVKSVAPPVYRPNPAPHVLQRKTLQPAKPPAATSPLLRRAVERGQRQPVQMKAQAAARPPHAPTSRGVVQRVIVIEQFGADKVKRKFTVKNSNSDRTYSKSADRLIAAFEDKGLKKGWVGHLRKMVGDSTKYRFATLKDLLTELIKTYPLADANKKRKREEKNQILNQHKTNLGNIETKYSRPGKKVRRGSHVGMNKLTTGLSKTKALKQNITTLTSNYQTTNSGGKSLELTTGNIFQSQLAFSLAKLDDNVMGAYLEGNYNRVNDGLGNSEGIRQDPFVEIPTRLKRTVVYGEGAYKPGETVKEDLFTFENVRLGENTIPFEFRHMLVEEGKIKSKDEFDPTGIYALSEIPGATKGELKNNQLMDQNAFRIFEQVKTIDNSTVIGRNYSNLPSKTNTSTLSDYFDSYKEVTTKHTKETQNEFHKQNFYIARSIFGPFYNEKKEEFVPQTPPGSPFNQDYEYDK